MTCLLQFLDASNLQAPYNAQYRATVIRLDTAVESREFALKYGTGYARVVTEKEHGLIGQMQAARRIGAAAHARQSQNVPDL